jgi:hypothetical protein
MKPLDEFGDALARAVVDTQVRIERKKRDRIMEKVAQGQASVAKHLPAVDRRLIRLQLLRALLDGQSVIALAQQAGWEPPEVCYEPVDLLAAQWMAAKYLDQ